MTAGAEIELSQRVTLARMPRFGYEQDFLVMRRSQMEVVHGLVPNRDLGAWHISSYGPVVRLALDKNCRVLASEIELMALCSARVPQMHSKRRREIQAFKLCKILLSQHLELTACMSIGD